VEPTAEGAPWQGRRFRVRIWALTGTGYPWPIWMSGVWAIGLLLNAWDVYGRRPITEAEIRREIEHLRPQR
jgi:hypothetical protein